MIYLERMTTESECRYNFRIWRLIHILYKLDCIEHETMLDHVGVMDGAKLVGLLMDLERYTLASKASIYQF